MLVLIELQSKFKGVKFTMKAILSTLRVKPQNSSQIKGVFSLLTRWSSSLEAPFVRSVRRIVRASTCCRPVGKRASNNWCIDCTSDQTLTALILDGKGTGSTLSCRGHLLKKVCFYQSNCRFLRLLTSLIAPIMTWPSVSMKRASLFAHSVMSFEVEWFVVSGMTDFQPSKNHLFGW